MTRVNHVAEVGFIGLGKLGLPCAEVMARYHNVTGYDIALRQSERVRRADSLAKAVRGKEFVFIAVPTPHDACYDGSVPTSHLPPREFDYSEVKAVLEQMRPHAAPGQKIVLISTVLPGVCRRELARLTPLGATLLYNPYFIAMGTVRDDFERPEFLIIGTEGPGDPAAEDLIALYRSMIGDQVFYTGTWEEAESVKIFYNTFISFKLSFVNMIQDVAVELGHIDVDRVTGALSAAGKRIVSPMYMRAGMGDGGPCHPRDNIALRALSERLGLGYDLFAAIIRCREAQAENMARRLCEFGKPIVIVGKSYKLGVSLTDGSCSLLTGYYVEKHGTLLGYIDTLTGDDTAVDVPVTYLLAHPDSHLHGLAFFPGSTVVDPWRRCPAVPGCEVVHYGNTRGAPT